VVVDVFFRAGVGSSTLVEQLLGIALRLVNVKCLVEILKLFFAFAGYGVWMWCRYREDRVVIVLN
jgi:hypothetical protein